METSKIRALLQQILVMFPERFSIVRHLIVLEEIRDSFIKPLK